MGISLAKITDFFGLADDDMYEEAATPAPKKQVSRPVSAPLKKERVATRPYVSKAGTFSGTSKRKNTAGTGQPTSRRTSDKSQS